MNTTKISRFDPYYERAARESLFSTMESVNAPEDDQPWKIKLKAIMQSYSYEIAFAIIYSAQFILFLSALIMVAHNIMPEFDFHWTIATMVVNLTFLIDLIFHIACFGWLRTAKSLEYIVEVIMQCLAWSFATVFLISSMHHNNAGQSYFVNFQCLVLIARNIRLMSYMNELKDFKMIVATFKKFSSPFASMMLTLYTIMFIYAVIGIVWFNGVISRSNVSQYGSDVPYMYIMMGFNDFFAAMVTLFQISVENNWDTTTDMICDCVGNNWPRVYFVSYWLITTLIFINIIISFVLEIYTEVGEDI